jgi:hypothetical protein
MNGIFDYIIREPVSAISLALAIVGIVLAYIFYRRSQRTKEPCWVIRNTTLVQGYSAHLTNLNVLYNDKSVENLSVSRLCIWNNGNDTIDHADISNVNPLKITPKDGVKILDTKLLCANHPSSELAVNLSQDGLSALITFEYLDQGQGGVIQIVHTGITSDDVSVFGDIKGAKPLKRKRIRVFRYLPLPTSDSFDKRVKPAIRRRIFALFFLLAGIFILGIGIFSFLQPSFQSTFSDPSQISTLIFSAFCFIGMVILFLNTWTSHIPSGLEIIEEDLI